MRLPVFFMSAGLIALLMACSSSQKNKTGSSTPSTSQTPTTAVAATTPTPTPAPAPAKVDEKDQGLTCVRDKESRTLRIEELSPKGCKLWYSHYSTKDPVASSQIANTHCKKVHDIIKGRLEDAGFKCTEGEVTAAATTPAATPATTPTATPTATPAKK